LQKLLETFKNDVRSILTPRGNLSKAGQNLCFFLALVLLAIGYTYLADQEGNTLFPKWDELWLGTKKMVYNPAMEESIIWDDSIASFKRLIPAIAISGVAGVTMGLYMGLYLGAESLLARVLEFIGNIPPIAMMVVFLIKFGFDLEMFVAVQVFGIITLVTTGIYLATKSVNNEHIYSAKTLGASSQEVVWSILFFQVMPQIIESIRQSVAPAIIYLIAAEWQAGSSGWGYRFMKLYRSGKMEVIFPYLFFFGLLGIAIKLLFTFLERKACPWYSKEAGH
jgi:NitT/TauT family transport system permease protein